MNLIPWRNKRKDTELEPAVLEQPVSVFRSEMERLFDRFFEPFERPWGGFLSPATEWAPAFDITKADDAITVRAEVPGVDPKNIQVTLSGNILTVSGEKRESTEDRRGSAFRCERRFGKFQRSIELPATVDTQKVAAEHANGVLTIRLPRSEAAKPRRVAVTVG